MSHLTALRLRLDYPYSLAALIFGATLLTYNAGLPYTRSRLLFLFRLVAVLLVLWSFYYLNITSFWFLLHLMLLSGFYALPQGFSATYSLRNIPFLKIFLIAYTWAAVTVILPYLSADLPINHYAIWQLFFARFCFILGITIPFDIGDYREDVRQGLRTLPQFVGLRQSKWLSYICLLAFVLLELSYFQSINYLLADTLTAGIGVLLTYYASPRAKRLYYKKYFDGLMLVYWVLFCLFCLY